MILYDEHYRFLGISNETLAFLGYEDLSEFLSLHNDFADLFQKRDGYVYKFENFSWIDFILYSGAGNKNGIIQLKNGEETEVKIHIKEIYLARPIEEATKLYSVKIISEQFKQLASQTDPSVIQEEKQSPALNTFMTEPLNEAQAVPKYPAKQIDVDEEPNETIFSTPTEVSKEPREEEQAPLILNFDALESSSESSESEEKREETPSPANLFESSEEEPPPLFLDLSQEKTEEENLSIPKESQQESEQPESEISFLKLEEHTSVQSEEEPRDEILQSDSETESSTEFSLDFLKKSSVEENPSEEVEYTSEAPSFQSDHGVEDLAENDYVDESESEKATIDDPDESQHEQIQPSLTIETPQDEQKEHIIEQIKHDLAEIDDLQSTTESTQEEEEKQEVCESEESEERPTSTQAPSLDALKTFQIEETEEQKRQHSFSQTLKSLFKQSEKKEGTQEEDFSSEFQLKYRMDEESDSEQPSVSDDGTNFKPLFGELEEAHLDISQTQEQTPAPQDEREHLRIETEDAILPKEEERSESLFNFDLLEKESIETEEKTTISEPENEKSETIDDEKSVFTKNVSDAEMEQEKSDTPLLHSMEGLGLPTEEAYTLLEDFVYESRTNIDMINNFIMNYDFDNILYCLIKIRGSAEVLNLNEIIQTTNAIKEASQKKEMDEVIKYTGALETQIDALEAKVHEATV